METKTTFYVQPTSYWKSIQKTILFFIIFLLIPFACGLIILAFLLGLFGFLGGIASVISILKLLIVTIIMLMLSSWQIFLTFLFFIILHYVYSHPTMLSIVIENETITFVSRNPKRNIVYKIRETVIVEFYGFVLIGSDYWNGIPEGMIFFRSQLRNDNLQELPQILSKLGAINKRLSFIQFFLMGLRIFS